MKLRATLIGFSACLMWALLALFTAASGTMPPFQLNAICFAIGALPGIVLFILRPERIRNLRQPIGAWATGIIGLFGYHFLYFTALRNAPAAEASMIAYLWPLFIVLGSAMLPGERLRLVHIVGALVGFAGAVLIVSARAGGTEEFSAAQSYLGYAAALACAFTWSGYSLLSRRYGQVPTDVVTAFCIATSILSALCHLALETTVWPESSNQWLAIAGLGIFPVGLAFYAWDHGVKNGDIQLLGVASYAAPVLSTLALIAAGFAEASWQVLTACVLVSGGALIAVSGTIFRKKKAA
ncbi:MAG: EamA family transporter [Rhizobium sp.]|nr:EamA family transporter [Rhizobium sp.]